jgi:hypothetical protein
MLRRAKEQLRRGTHAKDGVVAGDRPPVPVHATRVVCSIAAKAILLLVLILKVVPSALFVLRLGTPAMKRI